MLDKFLFRFRSLTSEIWPLLGSWKLSIVLMVASTAFYFILSIYAATVPTHVVANIASLLVFQLLYVLLLLNTGVCLWIRFRKLRREVSARPLLSGSKPAQTIDIDRKEDARHRLRKQRFQVIEASDDSLFAIRNRWTAVGTYFFHGSFFLIAIGFLLSTASHYEVQLRVAVGEEFTGDSSQFVSRSAPRPLTPSVQSPSFRVNEITPTFWRDQLLFTTLEADLTMLDDEATARTRINFPLLLGAGSFLRLSGFGYTPRYELVDGSGRVVETNFVKMDIFPPGQRDFFSPESVPLRVYVELYPDAEVTEAGVVNRSLNLERPVAVIEAYRGRLPVSRGAIEPGRALEIDGLYLHFPEIRYWGDFTLVRDIGVVWIFAGFLLGIAGLALKIPGRREEARWSIDDDGAGRLLVWSSGTGVIFADEEAET